MTKVRVITGLSAAAVWALGQTAPSPSAGGNAEAVPVVEKAEAGGWRLSAGADYRFRFKTELKMDTRRYNAAHSVLKPQSAYPSRDEVLGRVGAGTGADAGREYDNGRVAPDSAGDGYTWNWAADSAAQYHASEGTVTFDSFYGVTESRSGARPVDSVSDSTDMGGLSLDLSRELWRKGDFSLGVSLGGSYFPERDLLSVRQSFAAGSSRSEVWRVTDTYDVSGWGGVPPENTEGGGFGGPGALLPYEPASRVEVLDQTPVNQTVGGGAWAEADMWLAEGRLCLTPEWSVSDRLALLGTVGVGLDYVSVSTHSGSWMTQNGKTDIRRTSDTDEKVIVQAILGLGARFAVTDRIGLSVMGEARLPRTEVDVEADPYEGEVEMGTWNLGTQVDYCF